jgi:hypothetical protein
MLCAGSALQLAKRSLDEAPYKLSGAVAKLASITFWSIGFFLDTIKPWFLTNGKFATVLIIPSSWGSQLGGYPARISAPPPPYPGPPPWDPTSATISLLHASSQAV